MKKDTGGDLVARWQQGDQEAAAALFHRYAERLVALARSRLSTRLAPRFDPEDVVQSAYRSFFAGARAGRYELTHGADLWKLLVSITLHKLHHQVRRNTAGKRAVGREQSMMESDLTSEIAAQLLAQGPSPIEAVTLTDEVEQLMRQLAPLDRRVLEMRLQGYNLEEIAQQTRRSERTVSRTLERIKAILEQQGEPSGSPPESPESPGPTADG
jgi:RNA polymerase sigma factor (sigma-70 family)